MNLFQIKPFLDNFATTTAQIVKLDLTVLTDDGARVSGTGRYSKKGESTMPDVDKPFCSTDMLADFPHFCSRSERGVVLYPIFVDDTLVGVVGFIAFDDLQLQILRQNLNNLNGFLFEFSKIISAKLLEEKAFVEKETIRKQISAILENFDTGTLLIDENSVVLQANRIASQMLHTPSAELNGMPLNNPKVLDLPHQAIQLNQPTEQIVTIHSGEEYLSRFKPILSQNERYIKKSQYEMSEKFTVVFFKNIRLLLSTVALEYPKG